MGHEHKGQAASQCEGESTDRDVSSPHSSLLSKTDPLLTKTCFHVLCPQEKCTDYLKNIQEIDRIHIDQDDEEACVGFYVDVIQACGFSRLFF